MTSYSGKLIRKTPLVPTQASASGVWTVDDAAVAVQNNIWPVPGVPAPISRSSRFRNAFYSRTFGTPTNNLKWTWSGWVKLSSFEAGSTYAFFGSNNTATNKGFTFASNANSSTGFSFIQTASFTPTWDVFATTTSLFRDVSAWYHVVFVYDSANATSTDRCIVYVNGVRQGVSYIYGPVPLNTAAEFNVASRSCNVGCTQAGTNSFVGYMTEINFVDGQALTPSSFGTTDTSTGAWVPMTYTGTYGNNGFYLNFKDNTSTTTMGYDYSGNGNHFTPTNISLTAGSTYDSMLDVPTPWVGYNTGDTSAVTRGNYATLNPLATKTALTTVSSGNLNMVSVDASNAYTVPATILMQSGKWYFEGVATGTVTIAYPAFGIQEASTPFATTNGIPGAFSGYKGFSFLPNGYFARDNVSTSVAFSYTTNDVIGYCIDIDAGKAWVSKNGTWLQSGDPANGTSPNYTFTAGTAMYMCAGNLISAGSCSVNFGQRPFSYTPPTGFKALCTTNFPDPTIKNGAAYMAATIYAGTGSALALTNTVNGTSFQPDMVWVKSRSNAYNNYVSDSVRGSTNLLSTNQTIAEATNAQSVTSFNSNGISLGTDSSFNGSLVSYVAWQWKESVTAGFDIVTYTGTGVGVSQNVSHNLGVSPAMMIVKCRNAAQSWIVQHQSLTSITYNLYLQTTDTQQNDSQFTAKSSTNVTVYSGSANTLGNTYVMYLFAEVAGYSKFSSYTGNGSADGPFVYCGFRPRYVMWKNASAAQGWRVLDTSRGTYNVNNLTLYPNLSNAEAADVSADFLSNGFKIRTTDASINGSGNSIIFAAFAENPFKYSNAR